MRISENILYGTNNLIYNRRINKMNSYNLQNNYEIADDKYNLYNNRYFFPKNYDIKIKFLGIIEYKLLVYILIINLIAYFIISYFVTNKIIILQMHIILTLPILLISITGIGEENVTYILKYFIKYYFNCKIILYM
jgi:hypothetical protein